MFKTASLGLEPRYRDPESRVLPLDDKAIYNGFNLEKMPQYLLPQFLFQKTSARQNFLDLLHKTVLPRPDYSNPYLEKSGQGKIPGLPN